MKIPLTGINIILAFFLFASSGCKTTEEKEKAKLATNLRFHVEANPDITGSGRVVPVPIYRSNPFEVYVERDATLDEGFMKSAEVVDVDKMGGFGIKITFDERGTIRLNHMTTMNKGKRVAIQARWTETRWLAAPIVTRAISDGIFIFTPDATREESQRIVDGLNNVIKELKKPYVF